MSHNYSASVIFRAVNHTQASKDNSSCETPTLVYSSTAINTSLIILGFEISLTFLGNIGLLMSSRIYHRRRTVHCDLLQSLCLIAALNSLIGMPSLFATMFLSFVKWESVPDFLCRARYFTLAYFFVADSINICFLSLERYDFVTRPFRKRITKQNIRRYVSFIWIIPLFIALLHLLININSSRCVLLNSVEGPYSKPMIILLSVFLILTCSFVVITNWSSFKSMRTLARRLTTSRKNRERTEKKMIFLTINIVGTYLVSLVPMTVWALVLRVGGFRNCSRCNDIQIYLQLLAFVRYMANPFIFMGFAWRRKGRKIDVLKNLTPRFRAQEAVNGKVEPFRLFPSPADVASLSRSHRIRGRSRMAPCLNKN